MSRYGLRFRDAASAKKVSHSQAKCQLTNVCKPSKHLAFASLTFSLSQPKISLSLSLSLSPYQPHPSSPFGRFEALDEMTEFDDPLCVTVVNIVIMSLDCRHPTTHNTNPREREDCL
jgi:hypothetical protein